MRSITAFHNVILHDRRRIRKSKRGDRWEAGIKFVRSRVGNESARNADHILHLRLERIYLVTGAAVKQQKEIGTNLQTKCLDGAVPDQW